MLCHPLLHIVLCFLSILIDALFWLYSVLSSTLFAFFLIFEMDIQLIYLSSFFSKENLLWL